jgi:putative phosphoesterase
VLIGVISDTHIRRSEGPLERLLTGQLADADVIIHAGDHSEPAVVDYLEFIDQRDYYGVAGNMDAGVLSSRLPPTRVVELGGVTFGIVHGWGSALGMENRVASAFSIVPDVIVFGHSHHSLVEQRGGLLLVNPGSAFWPRDCQIGTFALIEVEGGRASASIVEVEK